LKKRGILDRCKNARTCEYLTHVLVYNYGNTDLKSIQNITETSLLKKFKDNDVGVKEKKTCKTKSNIISEEKSS